MATVTGYQYIGPYFANAFAKHRHHDRKLTHQHDGGALDHQHADGSHLLSDTYGTPDAPTVSQPQRQQDCHPGGDPKRRESGPG